MKPQYPFQPLALVGNSFSDAYFAALSRAAHATMPQCAYCNADLTKRHRLTDGSMYWCDEAHRQAWVSVRIDDKHRRWLIERGWSLERWVAAQGQK